MEFQLTDEQQMIKQTIRRIASDYDDEYWRDVRENHRAPEEFHRELADGGWYGIAFPEEYGGQGMGLFETLLIMEALAEEGAWIPGARFIGFTIFGGYSVLEHGSPEQKEQYLPGFAEGEHRWSIGVTEPDAGLNTTNISTEAERDGDSWLISGQKQFISGLDTASRLLLLARTTPKSDVDSPLGGITAFIVDPDDDAVDYSEIPIDVYFPESTFQVHIDDLRVGSDQVLGEVDEGLYQVFDTLNAERVATGAASWGAGYATLQNAADYAREREVWAEPIGGHQAIQHPLADAYAELETSRLALRKAAWQFDSQHGDVGEMANVANLRACKAAWNACESAMTTFGGMSASTELGVASAWGYVRHYRTIPVSEEMIRNFIGQHSLDLPRSY
jgi:acyl-CoA dehydrogenase